MQDYQTALTGIPPGIDRRTDWLSHSIVMEASATVAHSFPEPSSEQQQ
jgi:hypothetical protein